MYKGPDRKQNRLYGYDYSMPGFYFATICIKDRQELFGKVENHKMILNETGGIVKKQWLWLSKNFDYVNLDEWVIMPNHVHGIIEIINKNYYVENGRDGKIFGKNHNVGNVLERSLHNQSEQKILPLYRIIGAFKTTSSKLIHQYEKNLHFQWQKSFYDQIIENEDELINVREYIKNNSIVWKLDENNPENF